MANPKNSTNFLLGEIHTNVKTLLTNQTVIQTDVEKLKADYNQRKGIGRIITIALGAIGGFLGHAATGSGH